MNTDLAAITSQELIAKALPNLTDSEKQRLITAYRKIMAIDTFSHSPVGSYRTNYHAEGQALFAELLPELQARYPDDPIIRLLIAEFS